MLLFSINRSRGYENPSLDIIVTERCSIGGCPLEEACEHCYLIQSAISVAISYIISVYCENYARYFTVILSFLAFHLCSAYFIYLVSCSDSPTCFRKEAIPLDPRTTHGPAEEFTTFYMEEELQEGTGGNTHITADEPPEEVAQQNRQQEHQGGSVRENKDETNA
jgi:hypothetical protein